MISVEKQCSALVHLPPEVIDWLTRVPPWPTVHCSCMICFGLWLAWVWSHCTILVIPNYYRKTVSSMVKVAKAHTLGKVLIFKVWSYRMRTGCYDPLPALPLKGEEHLVEVRPRWPLTDRYTVFQIKEFAAHSLNSEERKSCCGEWWIMNIEHFFTHLVVFRALSAFYWLYGIAHSPMNSWFYKEVAFSAD